MSDPSNTKKKEKKSTGNKRKNIDDFTRRLIVHEATVNGSSQVEIATLFRISEPTISRIMKRYRETGCFMAARGTGRRPILTERDEREVAREVARDSFQTMEEIHQRMATKVCRNTFRTMMKKLGLSSRTVVKKPDPIDKKHIKLKQAWRRAFLCWTEEEWRTVVLSDESKYQIIFSNNSNKVVRRREIELL